MVGWLVSLCSNLLKKSYGVTNPMSSLGQNIYMVLFLSLNFTKRIWNFCELILNIAKRVFFLKEHKSERKGKGIYTEYARVREYTPWNFVFRDSGFELGFDHWGQFVPLAKILGDIFIFRGTEICTPFYWCKGVCLLRFPTKIAEHGLLFIAQPRVISWFFSVSFDPHPFLPD